MAVTELRAVKTEKVPNAELISDLQTLLDRAKAGEIEGYLAIFATDKGFGFNARLSPLHVWEVMGFIEGRIKQALVKIADGQV